MKKIILTLIILTGFKIQAQSICAGNTIAITPTSTLTNITGHTLNPGGATISGTLTSFIVSPTITTTYTILTAGTASNTSTVQVSIRTITVNPQPSIASPTIVQLGCTGSPTNGVAFGVNFYPNTNPTPQYSLTWLGQCVAQTYSIYAGVPTGTQCINNPALSFTGGIAPGTYDVVVAAGSCSAAYQFTINNASSPVTFSIVPNLTTVSLTCAQPNPTIAVAGAASNSYTWQSLSLAPFVGTAVALTYSNVGTLTITAQGSGSCTLTKTISVGINTTAPQSALSPTFQNVTCSVSLQQVTLTAINPSINITHSVIPPGGGTPFNSNLNVVPFVPPSGINATSTYTYILFNNANGCSTTKTFTVGFNGANLPTYTLQSNSNFTLGCSTKSVTTINILNAQSNPTPGAPLSYTWIAPGGNTVLPNGPLNATGITQTINIPGMWMAVVRDNGSNCDSRVTFAVLLNTIAPSIDSVIVPRKILTCDSTSTILDYLSETPNISNAWTYLGNSGNPVNVATHTLLVSNNTTLAPSLSPLKIYTLTLTDNSSLCKSTTTLAIYQNIYPPKALISAIGVNSLTCKNPTITLTNQSTTNIPPNSIFTISQPVEGHVWTGPTPQPSLGSSSTYSAYTVGDYTLMAKDLNNGCVSYTTLSVGDGSIYPTIIASVTAFNIECGENGVVVTPTVASVSGAGSYTWTAPTGGLMSSFSALNPTITSTGDFTLTVENAVTGCLAPSKVFTVRNGTMSAGFTPDPLKGYAPITITFKNNAAAGLITSSITTKWQFGIGSNTTLITGVVSGTASGGVPTTTDVLQSPAVTYSAPGVYTVVAYSGRGKCLASSTVVITLESKVSYLIPNIFTPDNDGINDVYYLTNVSGITHVNAVIYDRVGNIVYKAESHDDNGNANIFWDGTEGNAKALPAGVYMYVLDLKGIDNVAIPQQKGTISLVRKE